LFNKDVFAIWVFAESLSEIFDDTPTILHRKFGIIFDFIIAKVINIENTVFVLISSSLSGNVTQFKCINLTEFHGAQPAGEIITIINEFLSSKSTFRIANTLSPFSIKIVFIKSSKKT